MVFVLGFKAHHGVFVMKVMEELREFRVRDWTFLVFAEIQLDKVRTVQWEGDLLVKRSLRNNLLELVCNQHQEKS